MSCLLNINYQIWLKEPTPNEKKTLYHLGDSRDLEIISHKFILRLDLSLAYLNQACCPPPF